MKSESVNVNRIERRLPSFRIAINCNIQLSQSCGRAPTGYLGGHEGIMAVRPPERQWTPNRRWGCRTKIRRRRRRLTGTARLIVIRDTISRIKILVVVILVIEVRIVGNGLGLGRRGLVRLPSIRGEPYIPVLARRRCGGNGQTNVVALGPLDESVVTLAVNLVTRLTLHFAGSEVMVVFLLGWLKLIRERRRLIRRNCELANWSLLALRGQRGSQFV